jgi:hypothetical protein
MANGAATIPLLHRFLGLGLLALAAAGFVLVYLGVGPLLRPDSLSRTLGYVFSGSAVVLAAVAFLIFKPRVPDRPSTQTVEEYWATPHVAIKILPVWFLLEGAGSLSALSYLLTGELLSAVTTFLTIGAFWLCGPNMFAKA